MRKKILGIAVMAVVAVAAAWRHWLVGKVEADIAVTLGEDVLSNIPMGHPLTYRDVGTKI